MSVTHFIKVKMLAIHSNSRGQIAPLAMLGMLPLVMLLGLIFNTSEQIVDKTRSQNGIDAAVMTQATWTARSLNVMSMNNVALTQTHALNILTMTLMPELLELSAYSVEKFLDHLKNGRTCISSASACGPFAPACIAVCVVVFGGLLAHLTIMVIVPLIEIWQDMDIPVTDFLFSPGDLVGFGGSGPGFQGDSTALGIISDFAQMGLALEKMNKHVAEQSKTFAENTVRKVSEINGLTPLNETVFLYAAYKKDDPYGLPVQEVSFASGDGVLSALGREVCKTGYLGTAFFDPSAIIGSLDFNFQEHGYDWYKGPFPVGRDSVSAAIKKPREALVGFPHGGKSPKVRFDSTIEPAYAAACAGRIFLNVPPGPFVPYRIASDPGGRPLYKHALFAGDEISRNSRDEWSIFGFSRYKRPQVTFMSGWFVNDPDAQYGSAQAEVYNGVWYDLYTQDWHAKLVSTHMLEGALQQDLIDAVQEFDGKLHQTLENSKTVLKDVNAH